MRKIFLSVLTLGFLTMAIVSCQSEKKDGAADSTAVDTNVVDTSKKVAPVAETVSTTPPTAEEIEKAKVAAPDFTIPEANAGIKEFDGLKTAYEAALKAHDAAKIQESKDKFRDWILRVGAIGPKMTSVEQQKFVNYMEKLLLQWKIVERQATK